jgi:hypothetical protein
MKILVLYVFHNFDNNVKQFFENCIFKDDNIDFMVIANNKNYDFSKLNLPDFVITMNRENIGRDFGGWSEGLLRDNLYKNYDKFIFANSTITGPYLKDNNKKWTDYFINGLSIILNYLNVLLTMLIFSHVQTYMFSMDKEALEYLIKKGKFTITNYLMSAKEAHENEIFMSNDITDNGWNIGCLLKCYQGFDFTFKNKKKEEFKNALYGDIMFSQYRNVFWNEYDLIFIKGNRVKLHHH